MSNFQLERYFKSLLCLLLPKVNKNKVNTKEVAKLWQNLHDHYSQPHRHYHTLTHIAYMFEWFDKVESKLHHPEAVQLAIWYHDIIYEPTKTDNERQSADYFIEAYSNYLRNALIKQIEALIMMTAKHKLDTTVNDDLLHDARYFLDMDLAILGREWTVYEHYAKQVRLEYQHVPLADYKQGRIKVLQSFLHKERLYFTDMMFDRLEGQARENIAKEIKQLSV